MTHSLLRHLTQREVDVLEGLMLGQTNKQIGKILGVTGETVKVHVKTVLNKLGVETRVEAATVVMRAALMLPCPQCGYVPANRVDSATRRPRDPLGMKSPSNPQGGHDGRRQ